MPLCTAHVETLLAPLAEMLISESGATNNMHKEKVQQLLSENETLRSQLALPAPVKTETTFSKINILIQCYMLHYYRVWICLSLMC